MTFVFGFSKILPETITHMATHDVFSTRENEGKEDNQYLLSDTLINETVNYPIGYGYNEIGIYVATIVSSLVNTVLLLAFSKYKLFKISFAYIKQILYFAKDLIFNKLIQRIVNIQKDSLNLFFIIKNPLKIIIITIIYSLLLNFVNRKTIFCQWTNITFWVTSKAYIPSMPYKNVINIFKVFWRNNFNKVLFDF